MTHFLAYTTYDKSNILLGVIMMIVIILSVFIRTGLYADCQFVNSRYSEWHLMIVIILSPFMLGVIMLRVGITLAREH